MDLDSSEHHLLTAAVVALHHTGPVEAAGVQCPPGSGLRLSLVLAVGWRRWRTGLLGVGWHGHTEAHAEPLVPSGHVVQAARMRRRVVADGRVLVGTLGARQRQPVWTQEVVQVLVTVTGRQRGAAVAAVQRERETAKPRVPARFHGGRGEAVVYDVELGELLDRRAAVVVRVSRVH